MNGAPSSATQKHVNVFTKKRAREEDAEPIKCTDHPVYALYTAGVIEDMRDTLVAGLLKHAKNAKIEDTKKILNNAAVHFELAKTQGRSIIMDMLTAHYDDIFTASDKKSKHAKVKKAE